MKKCSYCGKVNWIVIASIVVLILLGILFVNLYKKQAVITKYTKAIQINPNNAVAYKDRGNAYSDVKQYDKAILDYTRAIEIDSKYSAAYYDRGLTYDDKGNLDQAILDYTEAIEINPNFAEAYQCRGRAYFKKGNYDASIPDFTKAIEINPKDAKLYNLRAGGYYYKKEYVKARNDFNKAEELGLKLDPETHKALEGWNKQSIQQSKDEQNVNKGSIIITKREKEVICNLFIGSEFSDRTEDGLNKLLSSTNKFIDSSSAKLDLMYGYQWRGDFYAYKGNFSQAISDYMESNTIIPNYLAYLGLGKVSYFKGDYEEAISNFNKAGQVVLNQRSIDGRLESEDLQKLGLGLVYQTRGITYYSRGDYAWAIDDFTEAIKNNPQAVFCYYFRGRAYDRLGNHSQATSDYNKAIEIEQQENVKFFGSNRFYDVRNLVKEL